ncbi:MAG: hypothetical protein FWC29_03300 [Methanomassiliicoccaceae archaeon]|nr:hypothetical protein [Methanomassiliicoccaceae archaeon]
MHCKDISLHDVDFPLTENNISDAVLKWEIYVRTEYLVLRNGKELAVVRIRKDGSDSLFRKVIGVETVSLPKDTLFVKDPSVDVLNLPALASVQERYPGKAVVIEGMFSYINFVSGLKTVKLRAIDNIPPQPSRLRVLVDRALSSGLVDIPIIPEYKDTDLEENIKHVRTEAVMFPCKVSGMKADMPFYFLDTAPELRHDVTLIGCGLSKRIFCTLYGRDVPFINVCPLDAVPDDGVKTIVRCCTIKEGHEIEGNTAKIPWGATVPETIDAINALFAGSE